LLPAQLQQGTQAHSMAYLVLARKYRPTTFADLVGQQHIVRTLHNAMALGRVHHAFVFTGARGVGKTTTARILARSLNCAQGATAEPCGTCVPCVEILAGRCADVLEIDGASNTGVDSVRELRDNVRYLPSLCRTKVYIIDEVHMLSQAAFNALLKTLEEPPGHVKFIFATTEPHKIPMTILSRCQRFDFRRVGHAVLAAHLREILSKEAMQLSATVVNAVVREAQGSVRDALSLLDQVLSYRGLQAQSATTGTAGSAAPAGTGTAGSAAPAGTAATAGAAATAGTTATAAPAATVAADPTAADDAQLLDALGIMNHQVIFSLWEAILRRQAAPLLAAVQDLDARGHDLAQVGSHLAEHVRDLAVLRAIAAPPGDLMDRTDSEIKALRAQAELRSVADLQRLFTQTMAVAADVGRSSMPKVTLEMGLLCLLQVLPTCDLETLVQRLDALVQGRPSGPTPGGSPVATPPAPPAAAPPIKPSTVPGKLTPQAAARNHFDQAVQSLTGSRSVTGPASGPTAVANTATVQTSAAAQRHIGRAEGLSAAGISAALESPSAAANSPAAGSPFAAADSPAAGSPSAAGNSPAAGSPSTAADSPAAGSPSAAADSPAAGSPSAAGNSPAAGSSFAAADSPAAGSPSAAADLPAAGSPSAAGAQQSAETASTAGTSSTSWSAAPSPASAAPQAAEDPPAAWQRFVERLRSTGPAVASVLEHGRVVEFGPAGVKVAYRSGSFYWDAIREADTQLLLQKTLTEQFGQAVPLRIVPMAPQQGAALSMAACAERQQQSFENTVKRAAREHAAVLQVQSVLGAEVTEVRLLGTPPAPQVGA
jgi:DNA polymerase-3 subunit gamma/tau